MMQNNCDDFRLILTLFMFSLLKMKLSNNLVNQRYKIDEFRGNRLSFLSNYLPNW